eukprot:scaffold39643_cov71-Phaeocystis_antarctica.AAC.14
MLSHHLAREVGGGGLDQVTDAAHVAVNELGGDFICTGLRRVGDLARLAVAAVAAARRGRRRGRQRRAGRGGQGGGVVDHLVHRRRAPRRSSLLARVASRGAVARAPAPVARRRAPRVLGRHPRPIGVELGVHLVELRELVIGHPLPRGQEVFGPGGQVGKPAVMGSSEPLECQRRVAGQKGRKRKRVVAWTSRARLVAIHGQRHAERRHRPAQG